MRNFQDTIETRKRQFISAFPVCMTVPLNKLLLLIHKFLFIALSQYTFGFFIDFRHLDQIR